MWLFFFAGGLFVGSFWTHRLPKGHKSAGASQAAGVHPPKPGFQAGGCAPSHNCVSWPLITKKSRRSPLQDSSKAQPCCGWRMIILTTMFTWRLHITMAAAGFQDENALAVVSSVLVDELFPFFLLKAILSLTLCSCSLLQYSREVGFICRICFSPRTGKGAPLTFLATMASSMGSPTDAQDAPPYYAVANMGCRPVV